MPMYSFQCECCGKQFEELTTYARRDVVTCPECGGATKVLVAGFAVKGSSTGAAAAPVRSGFS